MNYDEELHNAWVTRALQLAVEYREAEPGREVREAMRAMKAHLEGRPASMDALPALPAGFRQREVPKDYDGRVWIEGQVRRYGALCAASAGAADAMDKVAQEFAHRLAMNLECLILQCPASARFYDEALQTLGAYRSAMNAIHERETPTHMGEPVALGPSLCASATGHS